MAAKSDGTQCLAWVLVANVTYGHRRQSIDGAVRQPLLPCRHVRSRSILGKTFLETPFPARRNLIYPDESQGQRGSGVGPRTRNAGFGILMFGINLPATSIHMRDLVATVPTARNSRSRRPSGVHVRGCWPGFPLLQTSVCSWSPERSTREFQHCATDLNASSCRCALSEIEARQPPREHESIFDWATGKSRALPQ